MNPITEDEIPEADSPEMEEQLRLLEEYLLELWPAPPGGYPASAEDDDNLNPGEPSDETTQDTYALAIASREERPPMTEDDLALERLRLARQGIGDPVYTQFLREREARDLALRDLLLEETQGQPGLDIGTLGELLNRAPEPPARIEGLMPAEANFTTVAQHKVGKTTFVLNLTRSLITGEPFLGRFPVRPIQPDASVALLNYEVSGAQIARWANEAGIPHDRLTIANLRGRRNPLESASGRRELARYLRDAKTEVLLTDPFSNAFGGDEISKTDVSRFFRMLDEFARADVGAKEQGLVVHTGWNAERSRGSSGLGDWPDAIWTLTKNEDGERFFRADGRDVSLDKHRLEFNKDTRRLTITDEVKAEPTASEIRAQGKELDKIALREEIARYLKEHPGASGNDIRNSTTTGAVTLRTAVLNELILDGKVRTEKLQKSGGGLGHYLVTP